MASSSMSGPPTKYRRLEQLRRSTPYVSQSALSAICQDIRENGLPTETSRPQFSRATKAVLAEEYPYGPLKKTLDFQALDGSKKSYPALNIKSYLCALWNESESFKQLLERTAVAFPAQFHCPWGLIVYMDEVTPGNVLAARTSRKAWAIYASILEFKLEDLAQELAWFPVMHLRSSEVEKLQGGISQVFAGVLKSIFLDGICDPRLGLLLPGGRPLKIFLDLKVILQDGGSHKFCWSYKGDAALKPCLLCNLNAEKAAGEHEDEEVHFSRQINYSSLRLFSSQEILESFDRLEAMKGELSKQDFILWEKAVGKTYQPAILPLDKEIRKSGLLQPAEQYAHDWMHGTCSNGTFSVAAYEVFAALPASCWEDFSKYLATWVLPIHLSMPHLAELFDAKKIKKYKQNKRVNLQASEVLAVLPILVVWLKRVVLPLGSQYSQLVEAFLATAEVIFLLSEGQMWGLASRDTLLQSVEKSLQLAQACQWHMIPKFHWAFHMCDQLHRWGKLPSCFTCERKNKIVKKYATNIQNTISFENSLFQEIVAEEMAKLQARDLFCDHPHLTNQHKAPKKIAQQLAPFLHCEPAEIQTSKQARLDHGTCSKGDLVLLAGQGNLRCAEVWMFCQIPKQASIWVLVQMLELVELSASTQSALWQPTSSQCFLDIHELLCPVPYTLLSNSTIRTLLPWHWIRKQE